MKILSPRDVVYALAHAPRWLQATLLLSVAAAVGFNGWVGGWPNALIQVVLDIAVLWFVLSLTLTPNELKAHRRARAVNEARKRVNP